MKRIVNLADRHARALGLLLAAVLAALTAVLNVSRGPLSNLNDIGGWTNRMAFIALAAAAHAAVLTMQALLNRKGFGRLALRQVLTTLGFLLLTLPINQKTLLFTEQVLPLVRKMDAMGLAAENESALNLSAPALTLLYAVTRGPIYDMYSIKLLCVVCNLGLAILAAHAADRRNWGVRAEVLLTLCLILPQGFLAVGCAGQMDIVSAFLLCAALTLLDGEGHPLAAMLVYGAAAAMSGAALYALPLVGLMGKKCGVKLRHAGAAAGVAAALCLPALLGGMTAGNVFASLFKAVFALPEYAAGVPNFESVIPRAAMEEMPQYGLLRQIPALDPQTNASPFYTQNHFEIMTRGMTIAALAMFVGLCAALKRDEKASGLRKALSLALGAMLVCPGAGMGMWMPLCMLCLAAILREPETRLPACMVLFATAGGCCYPVTGEAPLAPVYAFAICAAALFMLLGVIPGAKKREVSDHAG